MSDTSDRSSDDMEWDPVFLHAKRETAVIIGLCLAFLVYTMMVCGWLGYDRSPTETAQVGQVFGIPTWAFWGLLVPWCVVNVITVWFCFVWMHDDPLDVGSIDEVTHALQDSATDNQGFDGRAGMSAVDGSSTTSNGGNA